MQFGLFQIKLSQKKANLFRPGGGGGGVGILPEATLDVNNFLNIKASATKLGDFFYKLSGLPPPSTPAPKS